HFLVQDVLAYDRIVLLEFELVGRRTLVLRTRVEVTRTGGRLELDFFAGAFGHGVLRSVAWADPGSDLLAAGAKVGDDRVDAVLVDRAQRGVRHAQANPAVLGLAPELAVLQVRQEATLG